MHLYTNFIAQITATQLCWKKASSQDYRVQSSESSNIQNLNRLNVQNIFKLKHFEVKMWWTIRGCTQTNKQWNKNWAPCFVFSSGDLSHPERSPPRGPCQREAVPQKPKKVAIRVRQRLLRPAGPEARIGGNRRWFSWGISLHRWDFFGNLRACIIETKVLKHNLKLK